MISEEDRKEAERIETDIRRECLASNSDYISTMLRGKWRHYNDDHLQVLAAEVRFVAHNLYTNLQHAIDKETRAAFVKDLAPGNETDVHKWNHEYQNSPDKIQWRPHPRQMESGEKTGLTLLAAITEAISEVVRNKSRQHNDGQLEELALDIKFVSHSLFNKYITGVDRKDRDTFAARLIRDQGSDFHEIIQIAQLRPGKGEAWKSAKRPRIALGTDLTNPHEMARWQASLKDRQGNTGQQGDGWKGPSGKVDASRLPHPRGSVGASIKAPPGAQIPTTPGPATTAAGSSNDTEPPPAAAATTTTLNQNQKMRTENARLAEGVRDEVEPEEEEGGPEDAPSLRCLREGCPYARHPKPESRWRGSCCGMCHDDLGHGKKCRKILMPP